MERIITRTTRILFEEKSTKHRGRPVKSELNPDSREAIINAAASIIARKGTKNLTIRSVCSEAGLSTGTFYHFFRGKDDLMMSFIMEPSFDDAELHTPLRDIAGRITELYMLLIGRYVSFGRKFVRGFYNPENEILSAYMGNDGGKFRAGTVMARSERELSHALAEKIITLPEGITIHSVAEDICTIIKGCVFEWCLSGDVDLQGITGRIVRFYMSKYV